MVDRILTILESRKLGYTIEHGAYSGTTDDRLDSWYCYRYDTYHAVNRRGPGYRTRREVLEELTRSLRSERTWPEIDQTIINLTGPRARR